MTTPDDYGDGMETPLLDDEVIEAFFLRTGHSAWAQDDALATLAQEVLVATGGPPPRPDGALLAFLEGPAPAAWAAPALVAVPTPVPAAASPWQHQAAVAAPLAPTHRRPTLHLLSRRLRLTAGIAAGIGIAAASLMVAGTTGVLPDPAMRAIVQVVEAVTPFELSDPSKPPAPTVPAPQPGTTSAVPATTGGPLDAVGQNGPTEQSPANTPLGGPPGSAPTTVGPVQPGSTGLDRAGQTPAGSFIPPFVTDGPAGPPPAPSGDGSGPPTTGVDRARETPAGTFIPPFAGGPPGRR
jgi:hypothetical protein